MFTGSIVALITPIRDGAVDEPTLRNLVRFHLENGTNVIVPCGTTGEAVTLTRQEWEQVITVTIEEVDGRIPVIAAAAILGLIGEGMRLPLVPMEESNRTRLTEALHAYGLMEEVPA